MAEKGQEKSLEMRVAELEDKLSKVHITEDEWKAYQKVASLVAGGQGVGAEAAAAAAAPIPTAPTIRTCIIRTCIIRTCIIHCIINCINECSCGPGPIGGGGIGGGFGSLGM
jgi:hypothetical protein